MDRIAALLRYLWTYLVVRLGPLWWDVAAVAGVAASVGCVAVMRSRGRAAHPGRVLCAGLLATYVMVVVAGTVAVRQRATARVMRPDVVARLWRVFGQGHALEPEPMANMLMFVPVGFLLPAALGWGTRRTILFSLVLSACIEAAQYLLARGECEPADVVLNVAGALVGYGVWRLACWLRSYAGRRPRHMRGARS